MILRKAFLIKVWKGRVLHRKQTDISAGAIGMCPGVALNVSSMSPIHLNINTPALCDAPQMETKSADVLPSDNLQDNADMHSSYATDDTASEIDVVPEDDNDGGSEKDMDTEDDEHLDGGQQPVGGKESTPHIPEGSEVVNPPPKIRQKNLMTIPRMVPMKLQYLARCFISEELDMKH
ncbi:hypothetical protein MRB53_022826 [Persea americana]|uniref:Uncharacterized protein n=1 Tax=Persea americana TaxID=3435 RepID=A0ACC2L8W5_PERAE|nr:hypothetical protein MRB53_022826 [Persea americana]